MANSIDTRFAALNARLEAAEKKAREQHGIIVALQVATGTIPEEIPAGELVEVDPDSVVTEEEVKRAKTGKDK